MWSCRFWPTPGRSCTGCDAQRLQLVRRPDAGEQQQLRRADGARGHDTSRLRPHRLLAPVADDTRRPPPARARPRSGSPEQSVMHGQVAALPSRPQVADRGPAAPRAPLRHLVDAAAFLALAVEVGVVGHAGLLRGADEGAASGMRADQVGDAQRAARAVLGIRRAAHCPRRGGSRAAPRDSPAGAALLLRPRVVVEGVAAGVDHGVDRAAAAQHPALGEHHLAPVGLAQRRRGVAPGVAARWSSCRSRPACGSSGRVSGRPASSTSTRAYRPPTAGPPAHSRPSRRRR